MVEVIKYRANDGVEFSTKKECADYEGLVKCPDCKYGQISYEKDTYPSNLPDSGWVTRMETFYRKCSRCNGFGYVHPDTIAKLDPEYEEYLRLQEKFKNKK